MELNNNNNCIAIRYILQCFLMFKSTVNSFYFLHVVIQQHQRNDQNTFYVPSTLLCTGGMDMGLWNLELQKEDISPVNTLMPPIPARRFVCLPSLPSLSSQCCLCQLYYYYFCKFYYCNLIIQLKFIWTDLNPMELHITSLSIYIN